MMVADMRIAVYFPAFAAGIALAGEPLGKERISPARLIVLLGATVAAIALSLADTGRIESSLMSLPLALCAPVALIVILMRLEGRVPPYKAVSWIAYASFFMYLFHRPVYAVLTHIWMPENPQLRALVLMTVGLALVTGASWLGQTVYDRLSARFISKQQ
jgi:peptidoglycan/LPS O-acetylase OafA/YrhL